MRYFCNQSNNLTLQLILILASILLVSALNETKISILICTPSDKPFTKVHKEVQQLFDNLNEEEEQSLTNRVELDVQYVDAGQYDGNPNTLYITRDIVCGQLLNRSVAVILLHYVRHMPISISSTAAYALGFYRVPTIGVGIQNGEFSTKSVYPTFLRTSPPYSNEARVFLHLLRELQYREVVVVHVNGDVNAMQFIKVFEEDRPNFKIHVRFTELFPP